MIKSSRIVVVDDDTIVTSALKTLFKIEGFSDAHYFNNPKEAVEFIKTNKPDLILSDFLMPEMNGLEFLSAAKEIYPEVSMILLTGYADKENAIKAINEIGIYRYIEKPWENDDLIINIKNGIERSHLLAQLREKIEELEKAKAQLEKYSHSLEELVAEKTADLVKTNSKLSGIITYCADGIIIIDENGRIEQVNPACENFVGLSEETLKTMNFGDITYSGKGQNFKEILKEHSEIFLRDYYIINSLRDKKIPVEISFATIASDEKEKVQKFVGVIRDVRAQKETERLRDDFIATLTHDLRTPLLAAIQTLKFFLDGSLGNLDEKQKVLLSTMQRSNEDLLGLVNALLEVYKYEAGKLNLCKTNFVLKDLINQCFSELEPLAKNKNIDFILTFCAHENLTINADRGEIRRVITNLCGNAINYTNNNGKIDVLVREQNGDVIFSVADNGNGIPKEDIPHLFKRFSQGTSQKRSTGTGLGLYLSRQIIEAHGGKIWLESKVSNGSEFSFLLTGVKVEGKQLIK
ncbi:MAG TPA: ATP-binding protein [Candidatus Gastranaerophilaceae bacterium]|nr:ATP-binding protein [Candidatus Gastranaerophilaceae bacterium]